MVFFGFINHQWHNCWAAPAAPTLRQIPNASGLRLGDEVFNNAKKLVVHPSMQIIAELYLDIPNLVMTNTSPWYRWPIEIDGLPIKHGDFPWLC